LPASFSASSASSTTRYVRLEILCRFAVAVSVACFSHATDYKRYVLLGTLLVANLVLMTANEVMRPCTLESINVLQSRLGWVSLWSCVAGFAVNLVADGVLTSVSARATVRYAMTWVWVAGSLLILTLVVADFYRRNKASRLKEMKFKERGINSSQKNKQGALPSQWRNPQRGPAAAAGGAGSGIWSSSGSPVATSPGAAARSTAAPSHPTTEASSKPVQI
jgi:cytochrome c biogenesis protein CcdA